MPKRRVVRGDGPKRVARSDWEGLEEAVVWGERLVWEAVEEEEKMWCRAFMFSCRFVSRSWRRRISPVERDGSDDGEEESEERWRAWVIDPSAWEMV